MSNSTLFPLWKLPQSVWAKFRRLSLGKRLVAVAAALCLAGGTVFSAVVAVQANLNDELFLNQAAETLRSIIGQEAVNWTEYTVYTWNHRIRKLFRGKPGRENPVVAARLEWPLADALSHGAASDRPANIEPLVGFPVLQGEGQWNHVNGSQGLWITRVRPNAQEEWEYATLVAIDPQKLKLTFVPGTIAEEPDLSRIPPEVFPSLVAAFNGGFRGHHLDVGMRKNGAVYKPLRDGLASIILTDDVLIRKWDPSVSASYPSADVRQNLRLLLENGKYHPPFSSKEHLDFPTYRTGLGITADHRWLIFAGGGGLEPNELAVALRLASCSTAVHLDQNRGNVFFETVKRGKSGPTFIGIEPALHHDKSTRFLTGSVRDFFYVTERPKVG